MLKNRSMRVCGQAVPVEASQITNEKQTQEHKHQVNRNRVGIDISIGIAIEATCGRGWLNSEESAFDVQTAQNFTTSETRVGE